MSTNKLNDKDIMNLLIDTAIANGASSADCVLSRSRGVSITRRLGKDENIQRNEDFDTGLRVFVGNKISSVSNKQLLGTRQFNTNFLSAIFLFGFLVKSVKSSRFNLCQFSINKVNKKLNLEIFLFIKIIKYI